MPLSCSTERRCGAGSPKRMSYILRTTFRRASASRASLAWCNKRSARAPPGWPAAYSRTPASPTQTRRQPTRAAKETAAWDTRAPGSSIRQASPPTGMWVRGPFLSTMTNAPSRTSNWPFSMKRIEARSLIGIGRGGAIPDTEQGTQARRMSIRPQPYAFAEPNPRKMALTNNTGSRTCNTPSMSSVEKRIGTAPRRGIRCC